MNLESYLNEVLRKDGERKKKTASSYNQLYTKLKETIEQHYKKEVKTVQKSGSQSKNTSIGLSSDLDMIIIFNHKNENDANFLKDKFNELYTLLKRTYEKTTIRKQNVSIGLYFQQGLNIDVLPAIGIKGGDGKSLQLYQNIKQPKLIRTSVAKQEKAINELASKDIRKLIRLTKIWKKCVKKINPDFHLKSILIELFAVNFLKTTEAQAQGNKLIHFLVYMDKKMQDSEFKLRDPGNKQNDLLETLEQSQKGFVRNQIQKVLKLLRQAEQDTNKIKELEIYFKL